MSSIPLTPPRSVAIPWRRTALRWMATFAGFPLGAVAARAVAGPVDSPAAALLGGLVSGAVLGAAQAWALRPSGLPSLRWIAATALGLMVGLGVGASVVDFETGLSALVVQGAISGLAVGAAQALVLRDRLGTRAWTWPPLLSVAWAAGWAITTGFGVEVDDRFTVFGSSGALVVTALTAPLAVMLPRLDRRAA